ncbi:hypothetical protein EVA_10960 [gut metagenome]|uniref:Uncharacterized protein n=1 Tax=gut metagenome TaxID=749906 RepID=J9GGJ0_9ZZZZ
MNQMRLPSHLEVFVPLLRQEGILHGIVLHRPLSVMMQLVLPYVFLLLFVPIPGRP